MDAQTTMNRAPSARALLVSLVLLGVSGAASLGGNRLIIHGFADRPTPRDLLFELLPYVSEIRYLSAAALVAAFALFGYHALRMVPVELPEYVAIFALMYLLRAGLMVLTPLASAHGEGPFVFALIQYGMFPSGHFAAAVLLARMTDRSRAPGLKLALTLLAVAEGASLILAHGHYSIDLAGGFLLAYFVEREWRDGRLFNVVKRAMNIGLGESRGRVTPPPEPGPEGYAR